jgi:hypothetical protein
MRPEAAIVRARATRRFGRRMQAAGLASVTAIAVFAHCCLPMLF